MFTRVRLTAASEAVSSWARRSRRRETLPTVLLRRSDVTAPAVALSAAVVPASSEQGTSRTIGLGWLEVAAPAANVTTHTVSKRSAVPVPQTTVTPCPQAATTACSAGFTRHHFPGDNAVSFNNEGGGAPGGKGGGGAWMSHAWGGTAAAR